MFRPGDQTRSECVTELGKQGAGTEHAQYGHRDASIVDFAYPRLCSPTRGPARREHVLSLQEPDIISVMKRHDNYVTTYQDSPHYARVLSFDADAIDVRLLRNGELTAKKMKFDIQHVQSPG